MHKINIFFEKRHFRKSTLKKYHSCSFYTKTVTGQVLPQNNILIVLQLKLLELKICHYMLYGDKRGHESISITYIYQ